MPAAASVGETLSGSFDLTNHSTSEDPSFTICDIGGTGPCEDSEGMILIPSCGQDADHTCTPAGADPGVFSIHQPGIGAEDSSCADTTFLTPSVDGALGKVRFAPTGGLDVTLSQADDTCRVDFTFAVLKVPTIDARPQPGIQTAAVISASARTYLNDEVSDSASSVLTVIPPPPPPAPSLTATDPDSPANDNAPKVSGTAPAGTTVSVYTSPSCTGSPAAQGTMSAFVSPGLTAAVPDNSTTTFYATATDPATALSSACSTSSRTYVEDSTAPTTTIDSGPPEVTGETTPTFTFSSNDPSASFACALDSAPFVPCTSPLRTSTLANGSHTFQVRATDAVGNTDETPADRSFTVALTGANPPFTVKTPFRPSDLPGCTLTGNTIMGTPGNDTLRGTATTDIIVGLSSRDALRGLGARDCLFGGGGIDRLFGGSGADLLFGGPGNDRLNGDAGNDRLSGNTGTDRIDGGAGNDNLLGGSGIDRLGDPRGSDRFSGGTGNDRIDARDRSSIGRRGRDRILCGAGRDIVIADPRDSIARDCETVIKRSS